VARPLEGQTHPRRHEGVCRVLRHDWVLLRLPDSVVVIIGPQSTWVRQAVPLGSKHGYNCDVHGCQHCCGELCVCVCVCVADDAVCVCVKPMIQCVVAWRYMLAALFLFPCPVQAAGAAHLAGYIFVTDRYFTSITLALALLKAGHHLVGTVKPGRAASPEDMWPKGKAMPLWTQSFLRSFPVPGPGGSPSLLLQSWQDRGHVHVYVRVTCKVHDWNKCPVVCTPQCVCSVCINACVQALHYILGREGCGSEVDSSHRRGRRSSTRYPVKEAMAGGERCDQRVPQGRRTCATGSVCVPTWYEGVSVRSGASTPSV
jgi:hypothetical protein